MKLKWDWDGKPEYCLSKQELVKMCQEYRVQTYLGENSNDYGWVENYLDEKIQG